MNALDEVARHYPVEHWQAGGIGLWPLVRYEWCTTNFYMYGQHQSSPASSKVRQRMGTLGAMVKDIGATVSAAAGDDAHNAPRFQQRDAVFYSDGVSFARMGGQAFEKFCDPLIDELEAELNATSLLITPLHRRFTPRYRPSVLIQPELDAALLASTVAARALPAHPELAQFDDAMSTLGKLLPCAKVPLRARVVRNALISKHLSRWFEAWLRVLRPKVVFLVAYYGNERAAMVLASKRLGIPCVDIQHGAISDVHFAYARLGRLPQEGYALLPDWFWVWTTRERELIETWASGSAHHRVVVGGNPFTTFCATSRSPAVRDMAVTLDHARAASSGRHQALYTASGFETDEQLGALRELIAKTRGTYCWWLRMHPSRLDSNLRFRDALASSPETVDRMSLATSAPLPLLMARMDVHLTEGSSSADEAAMFGVPTILFAREGQTQFAPLLARGIAVAAEGLHDVHRVLDTARALKQSTQAFDGGDQRAALRMLLT
jgi:hypothetical protein